MIVAAIIALLAAVAPVQEDVETQETVLSAECEGFVYADSDCSEEIVFEDAVEFLVEEDAIASDEE